MANRRFDAPLCIGERRPMIVGSFVPLTGAGTVVASSVQGLGFGYAPDAKTGIMTLQTSARPGISGTPGIVRTSAGLYTITCDDTYQALDALVANLVAPAAGTGIAGLVAYPVTLPSMASAGNASSFQIVLLSSSTPTDAPANCRVSFIAWLRDSTTQFAKP